MDAEVPRQASRFAKVFDFAENRFGDSWTGLLDFSAGEAMTKLFKVSGGEDGTTWVKIFEFSPEELTMKQQSRTL